MHKNNIQRDEEYCLTTCKDILQKPDFMQTHFRNGAIETFKGSSKYLSYEVTINHLTATQFDAYVKFSNSSEPHKFYNCDSSSLLFALKTLLKFYEIFGAPRRSLLSRIFHRNK